ncbi:MAG: replication factor A protein 2 [Peltula sp. TS41687]|nr:MAG: replication factor A protein 2 [Peltula sp. TS41687]
MNYGYTDQDQTTSYGAQGGAGAGGFVNQYAGSQPGSQGTPSKTYGKDTLRPVTIRQLLNAQQPHPDAEFRVDESEITQITFIGQIRNIATQTTNVTYKLDDGTAIIEVKVWNDPDSSTGFGGMDEQAQGSSSGGKPKLVEGAYVRVWGKMKAFNNKRTVGAHVVRRIDDRNEVQYHLLEATVVHLYFTRGPLNVADQQGVKNEAGGGAQGNNAGLYGQQAGGGDDAGKMSGGGAQMGGQQLPHISANARKVYETLRSCPQNNEGLHLQQIAVQTGLPVSEVLKVGDELQSHSLIFSTIDDETWATLEA